jgi:hypothetical protein
MCSGTLKQTAPSNFLMENFICVQCGKQFAETAEPPIALSQSHEFCIDKLPIGIMLHGNEC